MPEIKRSFKKKETNKDTLNKIKEDYMIDFRIFHTLTKSKTNRKYNTKID